MSVQTFYKSATKDVRPFFGAVSLEEALQGATIRLFEGQPFTGATAFTVEEQDIGRLAPVVRPNLSEAVLAAGAVPRQRLVLAVTALNPFLKKTVLVSTSPLGSAPPEEVTVGDETLEALGGGANIIVEVALCLANRLTREAGKPFLQGHWLSKKSFHLRPPKLSQDFEVDAMDDDGWKKLGLPAKTLYHVEYYGAFNEPANKDRPIAKVRVHSDVYKKLAADNLPKLARPLMAFLASEISCQLIAASLPDWKDAEQPESRSPLSAFLKRVNRIQPCTLEQLRAMVEQPGMPRLKAILHVDQESVRRVAEV